MAGKNSKQLHKHSLPIIVLSVGPGLVSILLLSRVMLASSSVGEHFLHDLTAPQLSLKPATNGLFHVSRPQPVDQAANDLPLNNSGTGSGLGAIDTSGQSTALNASLAQ